MAPAGKEREMSDRPKCRFCKEEVEGKGVGDGFFGEGGVFCDAQCLNAFKVNKYEKGARRALKKYGKQAAKLQARIERIESALQEQDGKVLKKESIGWLDALF